MPIRLSFHGAARSVTGSCFRLATAKAQILVDCGLFQGSKTEKELNYKPFPFQPGEIDAVVLTHAHIDHSGLLPKLVKAGFRGPILATPATVDLCSVMLPDSAYIQELEVEHLNRRNARRGKRPVDPIYVAADAAACMRQFRPEPYDRWFEVAAGIRGRLWNAGHLLGSASVELEVRDSDASPATRILFSGDVGPDFKLLQPDPVAPSGVDYVVCEGTYGGTDRIDATAERRRALLRDEVLAARKPSGVLLIPSFAVERAQELVSDLIQLMDEGVVPVVPVYLDSPLANRASRVFAKHAGDIEGGGDLVRRLASPNLHLTETGEQSRALDKVSDFHIVIAASGMCEAGRIRYRLKNWLWREEATVLLVGYQAQGTLGRILQDGAQSVRIQGDEFDVRARIRSTTLYSGHADGPELVAWVRERLPISAEIFLVHGEEAALIALQTQLNPIVGGGKTLLPELDDTWELSRGGATLVGNGAPPRLDRLSVARLDWHNDVSRLILDINDALRNAADEKTRAVVIRRLRRALEEPS